MDPCILEIRRDLEIGSELKVFEDACLERLKVILYVAGKMVRRREFQSLDVIGINALANAFVQLVSILTS